MQFTTLKKSISEYEKAPGRGRGYGVPGNGYGFIRKGSGSGSLNNFNNILAAVYESIEKSHGCGYGFGFNDGSTNGNGCGKGCSYRETLIKSPFIIYERLMNRIHS